MNRRKSQIRTDGAKGRWGKGFTTLEQNERGPRSKCFGGEAKKNNLNRIGGWNDRQTCSCNNTGIARMTLVDSFD